MGCNKKKNHQETTNKIFLKIIPPKISQRLFLFFYLHLLWFVFYFGGVHGDVHGVVPGDVHGGVHGGVPGGVPRNPGPDIIQNIPKVS